MKLEQSSYSKARALSSCGPRLLIAGALFLAASSITIAQHVPKLSVQNYKSDIDQLMALSTESAKKQPSGDLDPKAIAAKCADELEKTRS